MDIESKTLEELEHMQSCGPVAGVYKVIDQDYHKFKAISSTAIKAADISMAHFNAIYDPNENIPDFGRPDHFTFGSAFHAYVLDKEEFNRSFVIPPKFKGSKSKLEKNGGCKEAWDEWKKQNAYRTVLSDADAYAIETMASNLYSKEFWQRFTEGTYITEVAMFWQCDITNLQCKSKIDLLSFDHGILDLKTSKLITDKGIYYAIKNYRFDIQQAHYVSGLRKNMPYINDNFTLGWCEKSQPFESRDSVLTRNSAERAQENYRELMIDIAYAITTESFEGPGKNTTLEIELYDY